jgi:mannose-6-phosphate isomerase-like protein (cupin superfamily)
MKSTMIEFTQAFDVKLGDARSQAAVMIIAPGRAEGGPDNRHRGADQWLYVVSGSGEAIVEGATCALEPGTLVLIERGEAHEIRNTGGERLATLNFYVPPAYAEDGSELAAGRSS